MDILDVVDYALFQQLELPIYKNNRHSSIRIHGAKLFNIMPKELRNAKDCSVDFFKMKVDKFLQSIPDEPQIPGYTIFVEEQKQTVC